MNELAGMTMKSGMIELKALVKHINKIDTLNQWKLGKLHLIQDVGEDDVIVSRIDTIAGIKNSIKIIDQEIKIIERISNQASKKTSPLRIVFFENDTGEIFGFKNKTDAINHVTKTGWIEKILQMDDLNTVIVALMIPVDPAIVVGMINDASIASDITSTVFSLDKTGKYEQVWSDSKINDKNDYFICTKEIARIDATHQDPDDSRRMEWSVDRPAINNLIKALRAINLHNRTTLAVY